MTGHDRLAEPAAHGSPRRFRWRIIPTASLFILGGSLVLGGVVSLGAAAVMAFYSPVPPGEAIRSAARGLSLFGGLTLLASGRWWWGGHWRRAIAGTVLGYAYVAAVEGLVAKF